VSTLTLEGSELSGPSSFLVSFGMLAPSTYHPNPSGIDKREFWRLLAEFIIFGIVNQLTMNSHPTIHDGPQLEYFCEMPGIKQEVFANALGLKEKQKTDDELMEQIAAALNVKPEAIRLFIKRDTFNNQHFTFNTLDKLMEMLGE
jgi:hypothetical protein